MTTRRATSARANGVAAEGLDTRLPPARSRTEEVTHRLRAQIMAGNWAPGARLPTEQQLVDRLGISRTVVREAVAALRADGLVLTRQGVGAFVSPDIGRRPFRVDPDHLSSLDRVVDLMELRAAIETEAAGLAAERRKQRHLSQMAKAIAGFDAALAHGDAAVQADFAFHCAVAAATANPFFVDVLQYLGHIVIPRQSVPVLAQTAEAQRLYLRGVQAEHRAIREAIAAADADAARASMSAHLRGSQRRYRDISAGRVASMRARM